MDKRGGTFEDGAVLTAGAGMLEGEGFEGETPDEVTLYEWEEAQDEIK